MTEALSLTCSDAPAQLRIGSVSTLSGVPVSTLRIWQTRYAAFSPSKTTGQHRLYTQADADKAALLKLREYTLATLEARFTAENGERLRCEGNNLALYNYGRELLAAYQSKGPLTAIAQKEPMLGIGGVKMENLLEEYRDKLDEKRLPTSPQSVKTPGQETSMLSSPPTNAATTP